VLERSVPWNYDLGELAQKHKQAANDLWIIRESYLSLPVDIAMTERPLEALQQQRDEWSGSVPRLTAVHRALPTKHTREPKRLCRSWKT